MTEQNSKHTAKKSVREYYHEPTGITKYTAYTSITADEITALSHYQNITSRQYLWTSSILQEILTNEHQDCTVVNQILRNYDLYRKLNLNDCYILAEFIKYLDNAIANSHLTSELFLSKGIDNADFLKNKRTGDTYIDYGYSSYSATRENAKNYATPQMDGTRIYLSLLLEKGTPAVYLGDLEDEIILPRRSKYMIMSVSRVFRDADGSKTKVYYLKRIIE